MLEDSPATRVGGRKRTVSREGPATGATARLVPSRGKVLDTGSDADVAQETASMLDAAQNDYVPACGSEQSCAKTDDDTSMAAAAAAALQPTSRLAVSALRRAASLGLRSLSGTLRRATSPLRGTLRQASSPMRAAPSLDKEGVGATGSSKDEAAAATSQASQSSQRPFSGYLRQRAYEGVQNPISSVSTEDSPDEFQKLQREVIHLKRDLEHQSELRRVLQSNLASERSRAAELTTQNEELHKMAEEQLRCQQRVSNIETAELISQVEALLKIKQHLHDRIRGMEAERVMLMSEREEALSDRACVACLDKLANTVLRPCRHLCCCEKCSKQLTQCPVCRQSVRDRLTVFMP
eukprot:TRINITY_DN3526_c0_g1_i1.p1 TRINITY_DN3526_c0_g1~~TRINITY_DN3526_c0_g1_i1.p1  ORF type:complete len:352 (-),score=60.65 TRINITY_DN3526_c0_g1_i1:162-1217(-)